MFLKTYIPPHIDYCSTVWGHASNKDKILKLQKRALRLVYNVPPRAHTDELFKNAKWLSYHDRLKYRTAIQMYKIMHDMAPGYLKDLFRKVSDVSAKQSRSTEADKLYLKPTYYLVSYKNTLAYNGVTVWNNLPLGVRTSTSLKEFKRNYINDYFSTNGNQ